MIVKYFSVQGKKILDKPNNTAAMLKLPHSDQNSESVCSSGSGLLGLGVQQRKRHRSLGTSFCALPLVLVMEKARHNFQDKNNTETCQLTRERTQ